MKIFAAILLFPFLLFSQSGVDCKNFDYRKADSIAINFPKKKYKTVSEVAKILTEDLATEHEKFRAIFRWITDNIEYNKTAQNVTDAGKVVRKNKAVCQGFANLLKEMCLAVNIPCESITGFTKTEIADINKPLKKTDHAWNCVKLYDKWYLVDVTWATSKYNVITRKYQKEFDEYYYLTPPERFILDHYPKDKKYQFLSRPVKKSVFVKAPVYYADFLHYQMSDANPATGAFKWKIEKPLRIEVQSPTVPLKEAAVLINADKYITPVELKKDDITGKYYFDYTFLQAGKIDFTVYYNGLCMIEYLIKVK
ncbi:MAG: transglutaminase domain-containing protein [Bacteroidia bacterium]